MTRRPNVDRTLVRVTGSIVMAAMMLAFTMLPAQAGSLPSITSFSPSFGPVGTSVAINGSNFTGATSVSFNFVNAGFGVNAGGTLINATVPSGATTGAIRVTTPSGTAVSASDFTVTPGPTISSFSPTSGPVGTVVTINGSHFTGVTAVKFAGKAASFSFVSDAQISATVPSGATTGKISVTTTVSTATSSGTFTVITPGGPTISSFSPTFGPVGTVVTINGSHFTGATAVKFAGKVASFSFLSDSLLSATVPSGATTGKIAVTTGIGTGLSLTNFTVVVTSIPVITNFSPKKGDAGTAVSIFGHGFFGTTAVRFNGAVASSFVVVSDKKITTTVPAAATTGTITVSNAVGTGTSGIVFTVTGPKFNGFSPKRGPVGTTVTINGSGFSGTVSVKFNGTAGTFTIVNNNQLKAVVPSGATTGHISVSTATATGTTASIFTVTGGPHQRTVTLSLSRGRLFASGRVTVADGYTACQTFVPVVIKRFKHGAWRWVVTLSTRQNGSFHGPLPDRPGLYRAKARKITLSNGAICGGDRSNIVHHA